MAWALRHGRRVVAAIALAGSVAACNTTAETYPPSLTAGLDFGPLMYAAKPDEEFPLPAVNTKVIPKQYWRQVVGYRTEERPGTVIVDTPNKYLYLVLPRGQAIRYGIGVGKAGFSWAGDATIRWKRKWPKWTPPDEMVERDPKLKKYSIDNGGMEPGLKNPLGARALYIFKDGKDTLYRVHGTNQQSSIGRAVSSGCIRMLNQDVADLYERVQNGAKIVVIPDPRTRMADAAAS